MEEIKAATPTVEPIEPTKFPDEESSPQDSNYKTPGYEPKPTDVTWGDHVGPEKLSHRHKYVAQLCAMGFKQVEIGRRTGFSQAWLSTIINSELMRNEIDRARKEMFALDPELALKSALPDAVELITATIRDDQQKASLRVDTAFRLIERTHGKAKQAIELGGSLIKDLFQQLDAASRAKTISVDARSIPTEAEWTDAKDSAEPVRVEPPVSETDKDVDEWLKKNKLDQA